MELEEVLLFWLSTVFQVWFRIGDLAFLFESLGRSLDNSVCFALCPVLLIRVRFHWSSMSRHCCIGSKCSFPCEMTRFATCLTAHRVSRQFLVFCHCLVVCTGIFDIIGIFAVVKVSVCLTTINIVNFVASTISVTFVLVFFLF